MDVRVIIIIIYAIFFGIYAGFLRKKYDKVAKQFEQLKKNHINLKNDTKLLQQENTYLKQMLNINTDSVD